MRVFSIGVILSILFLLLYRGRYCGFGTNLVEAVFHGEKVYAYDWALKFILTILTLSAGFQGGEVTPLFTIGATLGAVLAICSVFRWSFPRRLAMRRFFGGGTNTLLAAIFIGGEIFGYDYLPYFFIVCTAAYVFNRNSSIYSRQKLTKYSC